MTKITIEPEVKQAISEYCYGVECLTKAFINKYFPMKRYDCLDWVGNDIGGVYCIADMFIGVDFILDALENNATLDQICNYYWMLVENASKEPPQPMNVNFTNYIKQDKQNVAV